MSQTGILLVQLGTPDAPTAPALKKYLKQFLSDPRLIEMPRWKWSIILNLFILPRRPAQSAKKYARIWDKVKGSPLLHYTRMQAALLQEKFPDIEVDFGMQIGNPPLVDSLRGMVAKGVEKLLVFPMYPQYSATTTGSAMDCLGHACKQIRKVPALRVVPPYFEHPGYIQALAAIVHEQVSRLEWQPDHFLISFHGIPLEYCQKGDPYNLQVEKTTKALVKELGWEKVSWSQSYQSLFGKGEWLRPYTEDHLRELAGQGKKRVFIVTPGFTSDCLETLDEIGHEAAEVFLQAGGEKLFQCPCLNDHPVWIQAMSQILREEGVGWLENGDSQS
ncbi:MAG: ferrochelatase [Gemmataceae bacterium]|nr:ferrochelatase [Gemmataceae bacterium]